MKQSRRVLKAVCCKGDQAELALDFVMLDIWVAIIALHSTSYSEKIWALLNRGIILR